MSKVSGSSHRLMGALLCLWRGQKPLCTQNPGCGRTGSTIFRRSMGVTISEAIPESNLCFKNPGVLPIRKQHQTEVLEGSTSQLKGLVCELPFQRHFQQGSSVLDQTGCFCHVTQPVHIMILGPQPHLLHCEWDPWWDAMLSEIRHSVSSWIWCQLSFRGQQKQAHTQLLIPVRRTQQPFQDTRGLID